MGIGKLDISKKTRSSKPRGRPPKNIRYINKESNMDYVRKVDELKLSGNLADNWRVFW